MYADSRVDENEIRLLRMTKEKVGVIDEIFYQRCGEVDVLSGTSQLDQKKAEAVSELIAGFDLPDGLEVSTRVSGKED